MGKIILCGDLHFGVKATIPEFVAYQEGELDNLVKHAVENNIKTVCFLGDVFNDRKNIYVKTIRSLKRKFREYGETTDINFVIIIGNHDSFFKNTNRVNSPRELLGDTPQDNIYIIDDDPEEMFYDNTRCLLMPWMTKDSFEENISSLKVSTAEYCFGHFEIDGFVMNNNNKCKSTLKRSHFKNFKKVFSGHFHTGSSKGNIIYTGSLCELDWNDFGIKKGFYTLDTENHDIEFIESKNKIFHKIMVGEKFKFSSIKDLKDCFLKIYINSKLTTQENVKLGNLISQNISYELIDNTILNDVEDIDIGDNEDLSDIIMSCVETQDDIDDDDKKKVIELLNSSYSKMKQEGDK